ncbi:phage portal protein (plasmid) [Borreliella burgdorferi]|uniref:anti-CBASS protein Acb1 family protein n=3 Tax=Borreliella TaxID=64895 RepID=UPI000D0455DD|nr:anti-CBASS Acb1 family protein [Borreliella burgdorferi]PRR56695.1 phage portal protein [Borreliella burgdorferi]
MFDLRKAKLIDKISPLELYKYSIFFRNYIENVAEDCLKNGLILESVDRNVSEYELSSLKLQLKNALLNCIISYRFHGIGYVLVKTKDSLENLEEPVNIELPIGFEYLDYECIRDLGINFDYITYKVENKGNSYDAVKIHKSRLIIYENFDYILKRYVPCYTESFLLDIYLFEKIYVEIEKRIENHNFLFYKDESLVQLQDALSSATTSLSALTHSSNNDKGNGILSSFLRKQNSNNHNKDISNLRSLNDSLAHELDRLKNNLNNEGMFYTATPSASLEVVKYDLSYLKEALALIKSKIGADTKEPLTRSFNEQAKGLGNDGKGDRSNYYDFLKGVQEQVENSCNLKLTKYLGLDMKFNSLIMLSEEQKVERDIKLIELYSKYNQFIQNSSFNDEELSILKEKLFSF